MTGTLPNRIGRVATLLTVLLLPSLGRGQEPLDLFSDVEKLNNDYIRIGVWNLRHINLESGAGNFLAGDNEEEDFHILIATFAKAITDLGLDLVAVVEHQPRANEPNRFQEMLQRLNLGGGTWLGDETSITYDDPNNQFSNLQFGLLWDTSKVTIDPTSDQLLLQLRQPRDNNGQLVHQRLRAPWLVPARAGQLDFDIMVLHLKSGGEFPQADEVEAIENFIRQRQLVAAPRHLIVLGDWNIRPDQSTGRFRLQRMMVSSPTGNLMRVLTVEQIPPTLDGWQTLGTIGATTPTAALIPFTHFNLNSVDTYLDHIAISTTFDEIFDHPVQVTTASGNVDLRPGIRIARPLIPEENFHRLTDHLPVVLTLRTTDADGGGGQPAAGDLRIVRAIPNPVGDDRQNEQVTLMNISNVPQPLAGWRIEDEINTFWLLNTGDGTVAPGQTVDVVRNGRAMSLNNDGDTIRLVNPGGDSVDSKDYGNATSGQVFVFD